MRKIRESTSADLSLALFSLLLGSFIYIAWRPETLIMFRWFSELGTSEMISSVRSEYMILTVYLPNWFLYSLPNGLWIFSYTIMILIFWHGLKLQSMVWISALLLISSISEILQINGHIPGTFDPIDMFSYLAGCGLAIVYIKARKKKWIRNTSFQP